MSMQLDVATATILSAAVAAVVGGGITAANLWLARRSEERRQIRELAVKAALENWQRYIEVAKQIRGDVPPLDLYLVHAMHLVKALDGRLKTPEKIQAHLRQTFAVTIAAQKEISAYNAALKKETTLGTQSTEQPPATSPLKDQPMG